MIRWGRKFGAHNTKCSWAELPRHDFNMSSWAISKIIGHWHTLVANMTTLCFQSAKLDTENHNANCIVNGTNTSFRHENDVLFQWPSTLHAALFSRNIKYNFIFAIIGGRWMFVLLLYMLVVLHKMIIAKMKIAIVLTEIYWVTRLFVHISQSLSLVILD